MQYDYGIAVLGSSTLQEQNIKSWVAIDATLSNVVS